VRGLLGWSASGLAGRIHAGTVPLGDLAVEEFVLFTSYISCGLALPISPFFLLLLEEFGLQLQHLTPHSVLQAAIFVHLCEMFVGVAPVLSSSATSSCWSSPGRLGTTSVPTTSRRGQIQPSSTSPPLRCEVGKLAQRLGDCQRRGQRPPRPTERWSSAQPQAVEDQAVPLA
jgi:hypothetical protein